MFNRLKVVFLIAIYIFAFYQGFFRVETVDSLEKDEVIFLNVGQGDSVLLKSRGFGNILFDVGGSREVLLSLSAFLPFGSVIDSLFITHLHRDHYGALGLVLKYYDVRELILDVECLEGDLYADFKAEVANLRDSRFSFQLVEAGYDAQLKSFVVPGADCRNPNSRSVAYLYVLNGEGVLFVGGDLTGYQEKLLVKEGFLTASVGLLKVSHHCSNTSSFKGVVEVWEPKVAVCMVSDDNSYGLPDLEVVDRFEAVGARVVLSYNCIFGCVFEVG